MIYITLKQASDHLRLDIEFEQGGSPAEAMDPRLDDLTAKIDAAEALVFKFLKVDLTGSPSFPWDEETVPADVRAATLIVLAKLWDRNGTPFEKDSPELSMLGDLRLPTIA